MSSPKWDYKMWVITTLTTITILGGGYVMKTLASDVDEAKRVAANLVERQAVDDERFEEVRKGLAELKVDLKDLRDLLIRTHMKELSRKEGGAR